MEPEDAIVAVEEYLHEPGFGGYDFVFVDELSLGQICSICLVAMRNPVQTTCGHRFCEDCLLGTFRQANGRRICPQDRNPIPEDGGFFRDVAWEREILSLRVQCEKSERGCDWIGQLRHYEGHLDVCQYEDVVCDDCEEEMQRRFLEEHTLSECPNRIVECEYCEEEFAFWRTEVHEGEECTRFPVKCPQQCGVQKIPREEVEFHVKDNCLMTVVNCPYEGAGCAFNDKRINLGAHIDESTEHHLSKTWLELTRTKQELNKITELEGQIEEMQGRVEKLQSEKESMETSLQRSIEEIGDLKLSEKKLEVENMSLRKEVTELERQLAEVKEIAATESRSFKALLQTLETRLEAIEEKDEGKPVEETSKMYQRAGIGDWLRHTTCSPVCSVDILADSQVPEVTMEPQATERPISSHELKSNHPMVETCTDAYLENVMPVASRVVRNTPSDTTRIAPNQTSHKRNTWRGAAKGKPKYLA